jgi:hypothetical protein
LAFLDPGTFDDRGPLDPGARPAPDRLFARRIDHRGSPGRRRPQCHGAGLVERLVETTHARELTLFAGKLDLSKLGLAEKASVRLAHASEGDYRDWQAIDDWQPRSPSSSSRAASAPAALTHAPEIAGGTPPIAACRRGRKQFKTSQGAASCSPEVAP